MPIRINRAAIIVLAMTLLIWGRGWAQPSAQQGPSSAPSSVQEPAAPASPTTTSGTVSPALPRTADSSTSSKPEKERHWSGSLVDATCMAKTISAAEEAGKSPAASNPAVPHFLSPGADPQMSPRTGGPMGPGQGPATTSPDQYPGDDQPGHEPAQLRRDG